MYSLILHFCYVIIIFANWPLTLHSMSVQLDNPLLYLHSTAVPTPFSNATIYHCPGYPPHRLDVSPIKHQSYRELIVCLPPRIRYLSCKCIDSRLCHNMIRKTRRGSCHQSLVWLLGLWKWITPKMKDIANNRGSHGRGDAASGKQGQADTPWLLNQGTGFRSSSRHTRSSSSSEATVAHVLESRCQLFSGTTGERNGCRRRVGGFIRTRTSRGTIICEMFVTAGLARAARSASEHAGHDWCALRRVIACDFINVRLSNGIWVTERTYEMNKVDDDIKIYWHVQAEFH